MQAFKTESAQFVSVHGSETNHILSAPFAKQVILPALKTYNIPSRSLYENIKQLTHSSMRSSISDQIHQ